MTDANHPAPQFPHDLDQRDDSELEARFQEERIASLESLLASTQAALAKSLANEERLTADLRDAWAQRETGRAYAFDCKREMEMWRKSELALAAEMKELRKLAEMAQRAPTLEGRQLAASIVCARLVRGGPETESDLVEAGQ